MCSFGCKCAASASFVDLRFCLFPFFQEVFGQLYLLNCVDPNGAATNQSSKEEADSRSIYVGNVSCCRFICYVIVFGPSVFYCLIVAFGLYIT